MATAGLATLLLVAVSLPVAAQGTGEPWKFSLMPYVWLPSMDGSLRYGPPAPGVASPNVSTDASSLLSDLDAALMVTGDARKGRWSIGTDIMYLDLTSANSGIRSVDFNPG